MAVLEYPTSGACVLHLVELDGLELDKIRQFVSTNNANANASNHFPSRSKQQQEALANLNVPIYVGYLLRQSIVQRPKTTTTTTLLSSYDDDKDDEHCQEEHVLLDLVDSMMTDYFSIQAQLTLPPPLLYLEMTRTFLYLYVFTLPWAMVSLIDSGHLVDLVTYLLAIFLSTFALMGLEILSRICDSQRCLSETGWLPFS